VRPSPNDLYRAAQVLARSGQPVFPCWSEGDKAKRPHTKNGLYDATTNIPTLKAWWQRYRTASIGIPTGIVWDVLDVDTKNGTDGRVHLPRLTDLGLLNGCRRIVRTPSGGWHLYFPASPTLTNAARQGLGLDVRATGGYVLAPGSYIDTGDYRGTYDEYDAPTGWKNEPLHWALILNFLTPTNSKTQQPVKVLDGERQGSLAALRNFLSKRVSGERNASLFWATCRCIENGLDPRELIEVAQMIGLEDDEIEATISGALKRAGVDPDDLLTEEEEKASELDDMFPETL
jgi:hypothetical protein